MRRQRSYLAIGYGVDAVGGVLSSVFGLAGDAIDAIIGGICDLLPFC